MVLVSCVEFLEGTSVGRIRRTTLGEESGEGLQVFVDPGRPVVQIIEGLTLGERPVDQVGSVGGVSPRTVPLLFTIVDPIVG